MAPYQRILITGSGQLGSALAAAAPEGCELSVLPHTALDITDGPAVRAMLGGFRPDLVLHTAALTRVGYCEEHVAEATAINANGTENVLAAAQELNARLVYFSTDYVFCGFLPGPRFEDDPPAPLNIYGASKAIVEPLVLAYPRGQVIRISGVFGPRSDGRPESNFIRTIYQRLRLGQISQVVDDQWTALTYAPDLAQMVYALLALEAPPGQPSLAHLVCSGANTWFGWARLLAEIADFEPDLIQPTHAAAYSDQTPRPRHSVLSSRHSVLRDMVQRYPARRALETYVGLLRAQTA